MKFRLKVIFAVFLSIAFVLIGSNSIFAASNDLASQISQNYKYVIDLKIPKPNIFLIWPLNKIARTKVSVNIPADWPGQDLYISSTSPKPIAMHFGPSWVQNQELYFMVPVDSQQEIKITGNEVITPVNLDLLTDIKEKYLKATIDETVTHKFYINPSLLVESNDPLIISTAKKIKGDKTKISDIISATYDFVVKKIDYDYISYNLLVDGHPVKLQSAVETLKKGSGICGDYSRLMIALLRAEGVQARMVSGIVSIPEGKDKKTIIGLHAWVQAYVPGVAFIDIDPTWGKDGLKYISDIDTNHIRFQFSSPESEDDIQKTYYLNNFEIPGLTGYIYSRDYNQYYYSLDVSPENSIEINSADMLGIRELAPVFISDDYGFENSWQNTIYYYFESIFLNPLYLFALQFAVPVIVLFIIWISKKTHHHRRH